MATLPPSDSAGAPTTSPAPEPIARFREAHARATSSEPLEAAAVALATADASGAPSVRMVLLRGVSDAGFVFHTNRTSRKSRDIEENPRASLCFHWPSIREQVRVEGRVELLPDAESDAYFASRPRGHQLGAWASHQSAPIASRDELVAAVQEAERRFADKPVPRPPFWGGYRVVPERVEFWIDRADRLHERVLYERSAGGWTRQLLSP